MYVLTGAASLLQFLCADSEITPREGDVAKGLSDYAEYAQTPDFRDCHHSVAACWRSGLYWVFREPDIDRNYGGTHGDYPTEQDRTNDGDWNL